MHRVAANRVARATLLVVTLALINACGSQGCDGCGAPIPGGFPANQRLDNGGQVRVTSAGLTWLGENFSKLVNAVAGTGSSTGAINFEIPPSGCDGSTGNKLCCDGGTCNASFDIKQSTFKPLAANKLRLSADAEVTSSKILFETEKLWVWWTCEIQFDSTAGTIETVGLDTDIDLTIDANDGNKLKVVRGQTQLRDFSCDDISINAVTPGGVIYCNVADLVCPLFRGTIEDAIKGPIETTLDGMLDALPTGTEARVDASTLLRYFAHARGLIDFHAWGGGYAETENSGLSAGVMIGTRAPGGADSCVPDCDAPGAPCQPPPRMALERVPTFRHNSRPDGKPFHVGIGLHRLVVEHGAYALYRSGALCLRMDGSTVRALKSDLFTLLVPSLATLTNGEVVPLAVHLRPQRPPTVTLGKGTSHKNDQGDTVIDEALLTIHAKRLTADAYVMIQDRWVRLLSATGDLAMPVVLTVNSYGELQPVIGDLDKAVSNVVVTHSELLAEEPAALTKLFPSMLSVGGQALASGLPAIALPAIQGIEMRLNDGSITSVENNQLVGIFAQLDLAPAAPSPSPMLNPEAEVDHLDVPEARAFAVDQRRADDRRPTVTLAVRASTAGPTGEPPTRETQSRAVEWTYRVNGGFLKPWSSRRSGALLTVSDASLWLPGEHTIEVFARLEGQPRTMTAVAQPIVVEIAPRRRPSAAAEGQPLDQGTVAGCGLAGTPAAPLLPLVGLLLLVLRRRR